MDKRKFFSRLVTSQLALAGGLFALTSADAAEIISNMPGNDLSSTFMNAPLGGANGGGVHDSKAAGFTMGASPYTLDFVTLRINYFDTASVPMVQLYSGAASPTALIETLTGPAPVVGMSSVVFTSTGSVLAAGTNYWILVWNNAPTANSFQWMASSPSVTPTGVGATHFGYRFSNGPPPPVGSSTTFNSYSVNATLVPEPATFIGLGFGAALLFARRWKR
jgi:hypothetical protein